MGRNSPHCGQTGEPLAVPTSRYPYHRLQNAKRSDVRTRRFASRHRHPWRDSGVPFHECSPHRLHLRSQPYRTPHIRTTQVRPGGYHPCGRTPNTTSTYRVPTPTSRRYPWLPTCSRVAHLFARWVRVDDSATDELKPPLVALVDRANLLNVPLGQINVRASLVLTQDDV